MRNESWNAALNSIRRREAHSRLRRLPGPRRKRNRQSWRGIPCRRYIRDYGHAQWPPRWQRALRLLPGQWCRLPLIASQDSDGRRARRPGRRRRQYIRGCAPVRPLAPEHTAPRPPLGPVCRPQRNACQCSGGRHRRVQLHTPGCRRRERRPGRRCKRCSLDCAHAQWRRRWRRVGRPLPGRWCRPRRWLRQRRPIRRRRPK
jgi:hypothetical protein